MKRITIVVSGSQEESLAKQLAKGAAQMLAENWDAGCSLEVEDVPQRGGGSYREEPMPVKKSLQVPGFMAQGIY